MHKSNEAWAHKIIRRMDPSYKPRWEVFDAHVAQFMNPSTRCLNIGSGIKEDPEFHFASRVKVDTDVLYPIDAGRRYIPFVQSDLYHLPFPDEAFNVVLMRFVVEHLRDPHAAFHEIRRVLSPGGKVVILTTNILSPLIWMAKMLPYSVRKYLMKKAYGVSDEDVFPTYHKMNTRRQVKKLEPDFVIQKWDYVQDANWNKRWLFTILFAFHLKTKWLGLPAFRSNFIAVLEKTNFS